MILGWRAETALTPGYFISRLQREDMRPPSRSGRPVRAARSMRARMSALQSVAPLSINPVATARGTDITADEDVRAPSIALHIALAKYILLLTYSQH